MRLFKPKLRSAIAATDTTIVVDRPLEGATAVYIGGEYIVLGRLQPDGHTYAGCVRSQQGTISQFHPMGSKLRAAVDRIRAPILPWIIDGIAAICVIVFVVAVAVVGAATVEAIQCIFFGVCQR